MLTPSMLQKATQFTPRDLSRILDVVSRTSCELIEVTDQELEDQYTGVHAN